MKQYAPALKHIADIIEKGIREHPGKLSYYSSFVQNKSMLAAFLCFFEMKFECHTILRP